MKKILFVVLASISLSAHARHVYIDAPACESTAPASHGACVQNKTGSEIAGKLQMIEEIFYRDGSSAYGLYDITSLHADYFLDFAFTNQDFENQQISQVVYAVDYNGAPISGCILKLTPTHPAGKIALTIQRQGSGLVCVS